MGRKYFILTTVILLLLSGCATSHHGNFITSSFNGTDKKDVQVLGKVTGESKQKWLLYVFPTGKAPSTEEAINNAKAKIAGTKFLTDISIDDRTYWKFGYSVQVIEVKATAHK